MFSEVKKIDSDLSKGVEFFHAPSLSAAVRRDAELITGLMVDNNKEGSFDCLCTYVAGDVSCDVLLVERNTVNVYRVEFYKADDVYPFAVVNCEYHN